MMGLLPGNSGEATTRRHSPLPPESGIPKIFSPLPSIHLPQEFLRTKTNLFFLQLNINESLKSCPISAAEAAPPPPYIQERYYL